MVDDPLLLAIDQGTHASRAAVVDRGGAFVSRSTRAVALEVRDEGRVEQDPTAVLAATQAVIGKTLAALGGRAGKVARAGLAVQRASALAWRRSTAEPLTPILSWQDTRARSMLAARCPPVPFVRHTTGLHPNAHLGASKLAWMLEHSERVRAAREKADLVIGPLAAWLARRLTEGADDVLDPSIAQRTMLWDKRSGGWSERLLDAFGIDASLLPSCVGHDRGMGRLSIGRGDIPLDLVIGDQAAAVFANGEPSCSEARVNLGTGGFVLRRLSPHEAADERLLESTVWRTDQAEIRVAEGTINGCGSAVSWWERRHQQDASAERVDAVLTDESLDPPAFLNAVGGLGSPDWRADLEPRFEASASPEAELAGVVESVLFLVERNLRRLGPVERLIISGGLSRSDALCLRLANLSGLDVVRAASTEATLLGVVDRLGGRHPSGRQGHGRRFEPREDERLKGRHERWIRFIERSIKQ